MPNFFRGSACKIHEKMRTSIFFLCVVCCSVYANLNVENKRKLDENESIFIPTDEWQTVKEGQAIPKGLHVRINLETGKKEAKLLSNGSSNKKTDVLSISKEDASDKEKNKRVEHFKVVKESLLKLESTGQLTADDVGSSIREKFRSYKELKDAFGKLNLTVKTDLEIMNDLFNRFKGLSQNAKSYDEKLVILTDLEYLVHQFDNALEFIKLEGISDIVLPMLNSSESHLRAAAAHLLGSAAQSNVKVQIAGLENGAISSLLKTLWLNSDLTVQIRSVYALSCIIRNFPAAQEKFVKEGGLSVFAQVFEEENHKLKIKIITLLYDLLSERENTKLLLLEHSTGQEDLKMRLEQYKTVGLEESLIEHSWCKRVPEVLLAQDQNWSRVKRRDDLTSAITDMPVRPEHDFVEKVAEALLAMSDLCSEEFKNIPNLKRMVSGLKLWYHELSVKESLVKSSNSLEIVDEDYAYYAGIAQVLDKLSKKLGRFDSKDEL